jgi:formylglycine-generating enzyme required for sulfatase activity
LRELNRRWSSPALNSRDGLEYVWVPAGTFMMGCVLDDSACDYYEKPRHQVTLTKGYWIGQTEVTVDAYQHFASASGVGMPDAPVFDSNWHDRSHPIVNVSWNEASAYCDWAGGRLPTEAEWERAARGKREGSLYPWGNSINHEYANYGNDKGTGGMALGRDRWEFTAPVASFDPNGLGLYDMAGNVMEWVKDWFSDKYYAGAPSVDPRGPLTGSYRVLKGGGWKNGPRPLRSSWRFSGQQSAKRDYIGFRCACDDLPDRH